MRSSLTVTLTDEQAVKLESLLEAKGWEPKRVPYACYSYKGSCVQVTLYSKNNKLLIQGKGTDEFIEFTLEPYVTGVLPRTEAEVLDEKGDEVLVEPHFGIDESGKGDYFGPLVVAGVYVDARIAVALKKLGVCDSKMVSTSAKIRKLAEGIRKVPGIQYHLVSVGPERYNELYAQFKNLNSFLAWGHATVIEGLKAKAPSCPTALSDQFANPFVLKKALAAKKLHINLEQRVRAESDVAVAAASILARERFVNWMDAASEAAGIKIPLGASGAVQKAAKEIIAKHGEEMLPKVAKMHFKTTQKILKGH